MGDRCNDSKKEHVPVWTRRDALTAGSAAVAALQAASMGFLASNSAHAQVEKATSTSAATQWLSYGGDKASSKYSPIDQISGDNFSGLQVAWTWRSVEEDDNESESRFENLGVGVYPSDGQRCPICQHIALTGRGPRRRHRQYPVGLRPRNLEERNAVQQWFRASRCCVLG